jgi:hypothetical protein
MREPVVRTVGLVAAAGYALFIGWLFVSQPRTLAEVTGGLADSMGAYAVDQTEFDAALRFFRNDQFVEARSAVARADPAERHAPTQFYIAYSFYRQGWGRLYQDDVLYEQALAAVNRAIELSSGGRLRVDDPDLQLQTPDELKAEIESGLIRDASDLNPMRVFRSRK